MNVLLAHGAHPDAVDDSGRTALHLACEKGQEQIVRLLLQKGAQLDLKDDSGMTALHLAATSGSEGTILALLEQSADIRWTLNLSYRDAL
jgi:uncharacterized protein